MKYVVTSLCTTPIPKLNWWKNILVKFLYLIIPKANPDFEHLYTNVRLWWLELDENNFPQKEIGFNEKNKIIVAAPIGNNYGIFTDSDEEINKNDFEEINLEQFMNAWEHFNSEFNKNT